VKQGLISTVLALRPTQRRGLDAHGRNHRPKAGIHAFAFSLGLAALVSGAAPSVSAELKDPLTSAKGSTLCFGREYSADHLARHPNQMTKSVLLAFQQGFVDVVFTPRRGAPKRICAGCDWRKGAGIDTSDRKMIPNFNRAAGFDCMVTVGDSAEERGYFLIDPAQDAKSLTLFLMSPIGAESDKVGKPEGDSLDLGPEDRTFALTRIDSKACEPLEATVK
jgi:hypothetical protein